MNDKVGELELELITSESLKRSGFTDNQIKNYIRFDYYQVKEGYPFFYRKEFIEERTVREIRGAQNKVMYKGIHLLTLWKERFIDYVNVF